MKKSYSILFALLLIAAACEKEQNVISAPETVESGIRLSARIEAPTKVDFDDTYGMFTWSAGDKIAVHVTAGDISGTEMLPSEYRIATVVPDDPATTGTFFFVMSEGQRRSDYAVYPASMADADHYTESDIRINLPSAYDLDPAGMGTLSSTPMIAVNDHDNSTLSFKHVGGLIRLALNKVSPATETITVSMGKRLTGGFIVNDPSGAAPYISTDDNADEITFTLTSSLSEYTDGIILNIPVPTGTYDFLKVVTRDAAGNGIYTYEDPTRRIIYPGRGYYLDMAVSALSHPLCLEAAEEAVVKIMDPLGLTIEYSRDKINWTATSAEETDIALHEGERVYFRGNNEAYVDMSLGATQIIPEGLCYVYGNIMSLIDAEHFEERTDLREPFALAALFMNDVDLLTHPDMSLELPATTLTPMCYLFMFAGCSGLTAAPNLPAKNLAEYCYSSMFSNCQGIRTAPELPAEVVPDHAYDSMFSTCARLVTPPSVLPAQTVGDSGYADMFSYCASLVTPPEIKATTIGEKSFKSMFSHCSKLESAPELLPEVVYEESYTSMFSYCTALKTPPSILPATTLGPSCYRSMFSGCSSLQTAPVLPATDLAVKCYMWMFSGCSTLQTAPDLPALTLPGGCYFHMFDDCSSLNYIKAMFLSDPRTMGTNTDVGAFTERWVIGVASSGTFVKNAAATWTTRGDDGVPIGWTIETATE